MIFKLNVWDAACSAVCDARRPVCRVPTGVLPHDALPTVLPLRAWAAALRV